MFWRLLLESFVRQRRRKVLAGLAILLGTTAVTAMLALATTIGDRIHQELAVYGANIVVTPAADALEVKVGGVSLRPANAGAYLKESDLEKLKSIFWANNITGVSPELHIPGMMFGSSGAIGPFARPVWRDHQDDPRMGGPDNFPVAAVGYWFNHPFGVIVTGAPQLHPWWKLEGRWPAERAVSPLYAEGAQEIVVGSALAKRLGLQVGDWINMAVEYGGKIVGIVTTGDATDQEILYPLDARAPILLDGRGVRVVPVGPDDKQTSTEAWRQISRVEISARTKPEDGFARKDPDTLTPKMREVWYCRPYANSIAYQIREAIPGARAEQVRQVEQSEGTVLQRISGLMWLVSGAALLAAGFAVSAAMATAVLERRREIGLMRSLGAGKGAVALLFYAETGLLAVVAGTLGYLAGSSLAALLGARVFAARVDWVSAFHPVLLPVVVGLGLLVAMAGSTPSIRAALRRSPSAILREEI